MKPVRIQRKRTPQTDEQRRSVMKTAKPVRLQRSRKKGAKLQSPNGLPIVYVGRGNFWGNPFIIKLCGSREEAVRRYKALTTVVMPWRVDKAKKELRGKNLACWCRLDQPCHADVLLELANG